MHYIKDIGYKILASVESGNLTDVGLMFDEHWKYKNGFRAKCRTPGLMKFMKRQKKWGHWGEDIRCRRRGVLSILCGRKTEEFEESHEGYGASEMRYSFDLEGTKIIVNLTNGVR